MEDHCDAAHRRYLKGVNSRSLTVRNLQLSLYGLPFSIMYMFAKDGRTQHADGLMVGFNAVAWAVVGLQVHHEFCAVSVCSIPSSRILASRLCCVQLTCGTLHAGVWRSYCSNGCEVRRQHSQKLCKRTGSAFLHRAVTAHTQDNGSLLQ